jgi:hypothetical protein
MADCDEVLCDCMVCLDNKPLLRLECNGLGETYHYICRDCLMKLRQFSAPVDDAFPFQPRLQVKWKLCPTCRAPIKRASRYNALLRGPVALSLDPADESVEGAKRRREAHRGYLPVTELQDEEFARQQYFARMAPLAQSLIDLDNANRGVIQARGEVAQVQAEIRDLEQEHAQAQAEAEARVRALAEAPVEVEDNPNNDQRIRGLAWLIVAAGIIFHTGISITGFNMNRGGGTTDNIELEKSKGLGVIYIGRSEGTFDLWWSVVMTDGIPLSILITSEKQYEKLLEKYKFTTKQDFVIKDELDKVSELNKQQIKSLDKIKDEINGEKGGSRRKRKMKKRSSRRKR